MSPFYQTPLHKCFACRTILSPPWQNYNIIFFFLKKIPFSFRHEVNNQFEHTEFLDAEVCGPIETKTSHMRT